MHDAMGHGGWSAAAPISSPPFEIRPGPNLKIKVREGGVIEQMLSTC